MMVFTQAITKMSLMTLNLKAKKSFRTKFWYVVPCAVSEAGFTFQLYIGAVRDEELIAERFIQRCLSKLLQFVNTHRVDDELIF